MKFDKLKSVTIQNLQKLGYEDGDHVIVLTGYDGRVVHGVVQYTTEYQTLFPCQVRVLDGYNDLTYDLDGCVGITKVEFN